MKLNFGFGSGIQTVEVPDSNLKSVLMPNEVEVDLKGEDEVRRALAEPIGTPKLRDIVSPGEKIAIITSDITRPMPTKTVMPAVLEELDAAGVKREDITLVFGLGSHRKQSPEEQRKLAGDIAWNSVKCVDSDPSDVVHMGETSTGTPVDIFRAVAEADRRICLGNIEYHYFAGYSGGAKAIMPGVSTRDAIQKNHSMMVSDLAYASNMDTNPIRLDIEEAGNICGIDFILNVVLNEKKEIIKAVAGHHVEAHREGCRFLDTLYLKELEEGADIVLVSQGGAPKDINLYQTQKALDNAKHAVKEGGIIILIGSCKEGFGEKVFEDWILAAQTSQSLVERIGRDFQLGGHKAAAIAMTLQKAKVFLVSEMEDALAKKAFFEPFASAQEAFDQAIKELGSEATVIAMPYGGSTLPKIKK